jgi:hypothetical protein
MTIPGEVAQSRSLKGLDCQTPITASIEGKSEYRELPNRHRDGPRKAEQEVITST